MVTSLLFHSQLDAQTKNKTQNSDVILTKFLEWLGQSTNSEQLQSVIDAPDFNKDDETLLLSRFFFRFFNETFPVDAKRELRSSRKSIESTPSERQISSTLSSHILDSFWMSLRDVAEEERLVFQLYLEGLFPEEISQLLTESQASIDEKINTCKIGEVSAWEIIHFQF